ncbi:NB-ARC domain-containing protein [Streptomyces sp. NPDC054864]
MTGVLAGLMVAFGVVAVVAERRAEPAVRGDPPPPRPPVVPAHFVAREQAREVVAAVCNSGQEVGITTSLWGAGGFGKTLLAKEVCGQARVRRYFRGRVYFVTVGRDVRSRSEITEKVADAVTLITGNTGTPATDPEAAGAHLGRLLDERPRTLLVLDDVWEDRQLAPFLTGGSRCVRLITTRDNGLLPDGAPRIRVDQMTAEQAEQVLTRDLPTLDRSQVQDLLTVTGRWALLLRLANRNIHRHVEAGTDVLNATEDLLQQLRQLGPSAVDGPASSWDMDDRDLRNQAVEASVEASATLLPDAERERFAELGIFAEDEPIPLALAAVLWQATGSLSLIQTRLLCQDLARLSLVTYDPPTGRIGLHDVIRDYLRARARPEGLTQLHVALVDGVAAMLPEATPLAPGAPDPGRAWWQVSEGYLHDHLINHLLAAGQLALAESIAGDIRWVEMRLAQRGLNAPLGDLTRINTSHSHSLARPLARYAHIPSLAEPPNAAIHQLHARLEQHPHWYVQIQTRRSDPALLPCLAPLWPLPDIAPAAERTLLSTNGWVESVTWSADGRLAAGDEETVRVWDPRTGTSTDLTGHNGAVLSVAWSADGRLAAGSINKVVRVWDPDTGAFSEMVGDRGAVQSVAWAADGRLAVGSVGGVRVWDPRTGTSTDLTGHSGAVLSVAWAADGRLAAGTIGKMVRVWDLETGTSTDLTGYNSPVLSVAWATDGRLATGEADGTVRVWNFESGASGVVSGHAGRVRSVAWSTDGRLATAGADGVVRVWDLDSGTSTELPGHTSRVKSVAWSADGRLATGEATTVRVWDPDNSPSSEVSGHTGRVESVAWSTDGRLATTGDDRVVRIWDSDTGTSTQLPDHPHQVRSMAWSANGRLATASDDRVVRIWDPNTRTTTPLPGHTDQVRSMAWSANGRLTIASADGVVRVWNPDSSDTSEVISHAGRFESVAWSANGRLATTGGDGRVHVWDPNTRTITQMPGYPTRVWSMAWSTDGRLATASVDRVVRIWDPNTRTTTQLPDHPSQVRSIAWSANGRLATASADRVVRVWDVAERRVLAAFTADGYATSCAWSRDGTALAVAGSWGLLLLQLVE